MSMNQRDLLPLTQTDRSRFTHRFAPRDFDAIAKSVVFVLDFSASMYPTKLRQTRAAMEVILDQMGDQDQFNIMPFSDNIYWWREDVMVSVTPETILEAKRYVKRFPFKAGKSLIYVLLLLMLF